MTVSNGSVFLEVDTEEGYKYFCLRLWKICLMGCGVYIRFYIVTYPFETRRVEPHIARLA